jgi:tetratricopeptide (TPR) repeat protein
VSGAPAPESRATAHSAATRALELDDSLAEAHTSRAALLFFQERNPAAAEREFERALALNRGYRPRTSWYAILLSESGRDADALRHAQEAVALDPLSGTMYQPLGLVHYYGRRFPDAVTALRRAIDLAPQLPLARAVLSKTLYQQSAYADALAAAEQVPAPQPPDVLVVKGLSYLRQGDQTRAAAILTDLERRAPPAGRGAGAVVCVNRRSHPRHHDAAAGSIRRLRSCRGSRPDVRWAPARRAVCATRARRPLTPRVEPHLRSRCLNGA